MGGGQCYSVIEHFPGICEALNSIRRTGRRAKTKRERRKKEKEEERERGRGEEGRKREETRRDCSSVFLK